MSAPFNAQEVAYRTLRNDLARICLDIVRENANGTTWAKLPEAKQRQIIERLNEHAGEAARKAIDVIASNGMSVIDGTLDQVVFKGGFKAVVKGGKDPSTMLALAEAEGAVVKLLVVDPTWDETRLPLHAMPDQPDMLGGAGEPGPHPELEPQPEPGPDMAGVLAHLAAELSFQEPVPALVGLTTQEHPVLELQLDPGQSIRIEARSFGGHGLAWGPPVVGKILVASDTDASTNHPSAIVYTAPDQPFADNFTLTPMHRDAGPVATIAVQLSSGVTQGEEQTEGEAQAGEQVGEEEPALEPVVEPAPSDDPIQAAVTAAAGRRRKASSANGEEEPPKSRGRRRNAEAPVVFQ